VLLYLATRPERLVSTQEVSEVYGISKNHLVRVVQALGKHGYVEVRPGRSGGLTLARSPSEISLGEVFRVTEPDFHLVECFDRETNTCPIAPACGLKGVLFEAREAFLAVLSKYTLADITKRSRKDLTDFFLPQAAARGP
jgi:Rrf2 family nitric oxide-sensitive transcriptional repressor